MSHGTFDGQHNTTAMTNPDQDLEELSLVGGIDILAHDWNNDTLSTGSKYARSAKRLQQEELIRIQHRRLFYEQDPQVSKGASSCQTVGSCTGGKLDPDALKPCTELNNQLQSFSSIQPDAATPWERFLTIDPTNEQCSIYGKIKMAALGLQFGNAASADARVRAAAEVKARAAATLAEQMESRYTGNKQRLRKSISADKAIAKADRNRRRPHGRGTCKGKRNHGKP